MTELFAKIGNGFNSIIEYWQGSEFVSDHDQNSHQNLFFSRIIIKRKIWVMGLRSQFLQQRFTFIKISILTNSFKKKKKKKKKSGR